MSIATTDVPSAVAGFSDEATPGIPPLQPEALPESGDGAEQFEDALQDVVADEPVEQPGEDPAVVELRAQLEAELRTALTVELTEVHKKQIADLQRVKDREVYESKQVLAAKMAGEEHMRREFAAILQEYGIDPAQISQRLELADARVRQRESQAFNQQQQEVASHQQIADVVAQRFQQRQDDAQARGEIPLDPMDPEVSQWRGWFTQVNQAYFSGAMRAMENAKRGLPIAAADFQAREEWDKAIRTMNDFETRHRATLSVRQKTAEDEKIAKKQAAAKARQDGRGPQHTGTGNGAGGMNVDAAWAAALKEHPEDAEMRYLRYSQLKTPVR